jgi:hypothetical protein
MRTFTLALPLSSLLTMNGKKIFRVNPAYIQPNNAPGLSENTLNFALPSSSASATSTLSRKRRSKNSIAPRPEFSTSRVTNWIIQEPQTPIAMPEHGSTVTFGMLTPLTPSTSFNLNDDVTMDYVGADTRGNMDNGGLWGLGDAFTSP